MRKATNKIQIIRYISLSFFAILVTVLSVLHAKLQGMPSIDALCPFGGLETIYSLLAGGEFLKRIFPSSLIILGGAVVLAILFGRYFCGWLCALGAFQGLAGRIGKIIFKKRFTVPKVIDKPLRYLKYIVLFLILYFTWKIGDLIVRPYDPFAAFAHLTAGFGELWGEFAVGLLILAGSFILSIFYDRVFCKYLCPMGAFLGILSKIPLYRIRREESTCTHCNICNKRCFMGIDVAHPDAVTSAECINCLECVTACPTKKETLEPTFARKRLAPLTVALAGIVIFVGIIVATWSIGIFQSVAPPLAEQTISTQLDTSVIKGSHTYKEISETYGIPLETLFEKLNIPKGKVPPTTRVKDTATLIPELAGFETEQVREAVRELIEKK
ncbi:MAG TPA: 4Fe-4S binding protein [Spirochaetia bacterium]|nr:4Fe-4S binding protein [Spirochaetia bacterium]